MREFSRLRYDVQIIMRSFQIIGKAEPVGPWLACLNGHDRHLLTVYNVRLLPLGGTAASMPDLGQIILNQAEICLIILLDRAGQESVYMHKHTEAAISHVGPIICRGEFHLGPEEHLSNFLDNLSGDFFPVTNVELYSTIAMPAALPRKADMVLMNRAQVQLYYPA